VGDIIITRGYLALRAALALGLILLGAVVAHQVTVSGQRVVAEKARIAEALDSAHLGIAELTIDMMGLAASPGGQRAESLRGSVRRSAITLAAAKAALAQAEADGALGEETARLVADPSLDPFGAMIDMLALADVLREPVAPSGDAAVRYADAGVALSRRLLPMLKRMKETESAALDAAVADLALYSALALFLTAAMVLATALFIHRPMGRRILEAQREALERREAAEAASDAKSQFLATMSHEIRTPMNGVLGMADLLRATPLEPDQRRMVEVIARSGAALMEIIDAVLDLSKIEAGRYVLNAHPLDITETCADVVALFSGRAAGKGIALRFDSAAGAAPLRVIGDAGALRQILSNLVGNAVKFTLEGAVVLRLSDLGGDAGGGRRVEISVADTGVGIPAEAQARVFDRFEQADQSTTRKFGGTGLGLSIVRKLTEAMGGTITLQSAVGKGSTFTIRLALPPAPEVEPAPRIARTDARAAECAIDGADGQAATRALVAEDNRVNQIVVAEMLKRANCGVTLAADGASAVALFREAPPDIVFMDVSMPVMGGYEATRAIREHERSAGLARTPIYGLSAHALASYRNDGLAAGMDGFITKPVTQEALEAALSEARGGGIRRVSA
jgi:signal transduction histidine kinase/ActR/RegA family two-component response regulator